MPQNQHLTLPLKQSPDAEHSAPLPPLPPNGGKLARLKSNGAATPQTPENTIPSPVLRTTGTGDGSITFPCCSLPWQRDPPRPAPASLEP